MEALHPEFVKAEELMKLSKFEEAMELFNFVIKADSTNPIYFSQRGVCYYHLKDLNSALKDMNKSVELDPNYSYRYASRAYIKDAIGDVKGAVMDYQKATELDPEDAVSFNNLGLLEEKLGYIESSKNSFKKADKLAKLLEGTGVVTEEELKAANVEEPQNVQQELDDEKQEKKESSVVKEMGNVFKRKESFKEFIAFILNGFKTKE